MTNVKIFINHVDKPDFEGHFEYLEWETRPKKFFISTHDNKSKCSSEIHFEFDNIEDTKNFIKEVKSTLKGCRK
jgi:hypothetical protein